MAYVKTDTFSKYRDRKRDEEGREGGEVTSTEEGGGGRES